MRQLILAAVMSGATLVTGHGIASAQVAIELPGGGVYFGPNYYDDDDDYDYRDRRVYRYYGDDRYDDDTYRGRRQLRSDFNQCGYNAYWDGNACQLGRRP
ncbi:MAG: hypothetical protein WAN86_00185 [Hyphomicrobiaceae bacterium]